MTLSAQDRTYGGLPTGQCSTPAALLMLKACTLAGLTAALFFTGLAVQAGLFTLVCLILFVPRMMDISWPLTWFVPVFWLYSMSYPVLVLAGIKPQLPEVSDALALQGLALIAFATGIWLARGGDIYPRGTFRTPHALISDWVLLGAGVVLAAYILLYIGEILTLGLRNKRQIVDAEADSIILRASALLLMITTFGLVWFIRNAVLGRRVVHIFVIIALVLALLFALNGERNLILRWLVVCTIAMWELRRQPSPHLLYTAAAAGILLLPVMQTAKAFMLRVKNDIRFDPVMVLDGEFSVPFQNLVNILNNPPPVAPGQVLLWDLGRVFGSNLLGIEAHPSTQRWYNDVILADVVSGQALSLVAFGWLAAGVAGVIILFMAIGFFVRFVWNHRWAGPWMLLWYCSLPGILVLSLRSDLFSLLNQHTRLLLIPLLLAGVAHLVLITCFPKRKRGKA